MNRISRTLILLSICMAVPISVSAADLKILVVVSNEVEALLDGDNTFADIETVVGDAFEDADLVRPSFVLSAKRPEFAEALLSKSQALALVHLPVVSSERRNYAETQYAVPIVEVQAAKKLVIEVLHAGLEKRFGWRR